MRAEIIAFKYRFEARQNLLNSKLTVGQPAH